MSDNKDPPVDEWDPSKGGRPRIDASNRGPKFSVGDNVWLRVGGALQGPFKIATVLVATHRYTLSHADASQANGGVEVEESALSFV